jgi:plastocyanin
MWRSLLIGGWLAAIGPFSASAKGGEIVGRVVISRPLTRKKVSVPNYQMHGPVLSVPPQDVDEYRRVVIYLETAPATPPQAVRALLTQKHQRFDPEVLIVPVGSEVSFPNEGPIFHNVFSLSPVQKFDLGYYPESDTRTERFERPGVVQVYCHLYPDMSAAIVVAPNQWFTTPDRSGSFHLSEVPPGAHQIVVWHKSAGFFRRSIEVPEQGAASLSIEIPIKEHPVP